MFVTERIKQNVAPGDVLLSFNKANLFSRAITEVTHSDFSHAFLYIGNGQILESSTHGVATRPLEYYLDYDKYYLALFRPGLSEELNKELISFCKTKLGVKYSYLQIMYLAFIYFFGLKNNTHMQWDLPGIICSELVALGFKHIGWYPFGDTIPAHVTPKDHADKLVRIV